MPRRMPATTSALCSWTSTIRDFMRPPTYRARPRPASLELVIGRAAPRTSAPNLPPMLERAQRPEQRPEGDAAGSADCHVTAARVPLRLLDVIRRDGDGQTCPEPMIRRAANARGALAHRQFGDVAPGDVQWVRAADMKHVRIRRRPNESTGDPLTAPRHRISSKRIR